MLVRPSLTGAREVLVRMPEDSGYRGYWAVPLYSGRIRGGFGVLAL